MRGHIQPSQQVQQGCLARAAGTHEGDKVASVHVKIQPLQDANVFAAAAEHLIQIAHQDESVATAFAVDSDHFSLASGLSRDLLAVMKIIRPADHHKIAGSIRRALRYRDCA